MEAHAKWATNYGGIGALMGLQGDKNLGLCKLVMGCFLGNACVCTTYYGMARGRTNGKKEKDQSRLERN